MSRSVPEWIGKTDDTKAPPRVRLRIFEREKGICWLSGLKIEPQDKWELHHGVALIAGGENRESNLFPVLRQPHKIETARQMKEKSKVARIKAKHLGIKGESSFPKPPTGYSYSWKRGRYEKETT